MRLRRRDQRAAQPRRLRVRPHAQQPQIRPVAPVRHENAPRHAPSVVCDQDTGRRIVKERRQLYRIGTRPLEQIGLVRPPRARCLAAIRAFDQRVERGDVFVGGGACQHRTGLAARAAGIHPAARAGPVSPVSWS